MIETGSPTPLGAHWDGQGVNFALYSGAAESVELCLFDEQDREAGHYRLSECTDGVWHGYLPGCGPGQRYGYRVHGRYDFEQGLRCNPSKLLIDPYARRLSGGFSWSKAWFDFESTGEDGEFRPCFQDSAPFVPKSVVSGPCVTPSAGPRIPWKETILYEANVRGFTMAHPAIPEQDRGKFSGLRNKDVLSYLKALGVTSLELLPVHAFIDEEFLGRRGLRNFWGYNSLNFFTPESRYAGVDPVAEFRDMVNAVHEAGIELILDVVYNHTAEGGRDGPTLSFRGIDNLAYYRTLPGQPGHYVNDTGCGNTLNADHPRLQELVLDSLRYWVTEMGVDGFRFDLATVLGRSADGFHHDHALLREISSDRVLRDTKLIAEPWDPGPGGYHLGAFPSGWAEWNDQYRDCVRRYWRGDKGLAGEFAGRLHGSAEIFEPAARKPWASVNFLTSHDGFTLSDLVSYADKHNEANGEDNRDGHQHNYSCNHGVEGPTDDKRIYRDRRRQRLNMLATLMFSQGTPMLLGGDEFGNSQGGNNNAYAQDNETGWLDWSGLETDPGFLEQVRALVHLRRTTPLLRQGEYRHGRSSNRLGWPDIQWLRPNGSLFSGDDWHPARTKAVVFADAHGGSSSAVSILINGSSKPVNFKLPGVDDSCNWSVGFASEETSLERLGDCEWRLGGHCIACLKLD